MHRHLWILTILTAALLLACSEDGNTTSDTPDTTVEDTALPDNGGTDTNATTVTCDYPTNDGETVYFGKVMPPLSWDQAYLGKGAGMQEDFSLENFHCNPEYDAYNVIIFIITAEWCPSCEEMLTNFGSDGTFERLEAAGALLVNVEMETLDYAAPTNEQAYTSIVAHAGEVPGFIVGDGATQPTTGPFSALASSRIIGSYPSGFVVRRSDMVVIAPLSEGGYYLDLESIAADPDAYYTGPPNEGPPNCGADDEEDSEPANNTAAGAGVIDSDILFNGGVCDDEPDYFRVELPGRMWLLDLSFDPTLGDLDFYLWDTANDTYYLDGNGRRVGSAEIGSDEVFQFCGEATLRVFGYNGHTAPYRIGLTDLGPGPCQ